MSETTRAFLKALSSVTGNISGTWFAVAFITPNFIKFSPVDSITILTKDISSGIVWLILTTILERTINEHERN